MFLVLSDITNKQSSSTTGEQQPAVTNALKVVSSTVTSASAEDSHDGPDWGAGLGLNYSETPIPPQGTERQSLLAPQLAPQLPVVSTASPAAETPTNQEAAEHRTAAGSGRQQQRQTESTSLQWWYQDYCTPQQARSARSSSRVHHPYEPPGDISSSTPEVMPWTKDLAKKYLPSPEPWEEDEGEGEGSYQHALPAANTLHTAAQAVQACSINPAATSPQTHSFFFERINACAPKGASCSPPAVSPPAYVSGRRRCSMTQGQQADGNLSLTPSRGPLRCAVMHTPRSSSPGAQASSPAPSACAAGVTCSSSSSSSMADHWEMGASEFTVCGAFGLHTDSAADGTGTLSLRAQQQPAQLPLSAQQDDQLKLDYTRSAISTSPSTMAQCHAGLSACAAALAAQDSDSMAAAGNFHAGTSAQGLQACAGMPTAAQACAGPQQQDSAAQAANSMAAMSAASTSTVLLAKDHTADACLHGSSEQRTQPQNEPGLMQWLLTPVRKAGQALLQVLPAALHSPQGLFSSNSSSNSKEGNGCSPPGHEDQLQRSSSSSSGATGCSGNSSSSVTIWAGTGSSAGSLAEAQHSSALAAQSSSSGSSSSSRRPGEFGSTELTWRVERARVNIQRLHQEASGYFDVAEEKRQCSWRCYYDGYTWGYEQNWNQCADQADKGVQRVRQAEQEVQELLEAVQHASMDGVDPSLKKAMLHQQADVYILAGKHNIQLAEVCRRLKVLGGSGNPDEPARIARELFAIAKHKRAEAAQLAARVNNPLASVTPLDLHGLPVQDAVTLVQQQLLPILVYGRGHPVGVLWEIIVGQGLHSSNGEAAIKKAVMDFLQKQQPLSCATDQPFTFQETPHNKGRIEVYVWSARLD